MIWVALLGLAAANWHRSRSRSPAAAARGRREAALALHRAQLAELHRDAAEGRLGAAEHEQAVLEVQRRVPACGGGRGRGPALRCARGPLVTLLMLVPALALALYLVNGDPGLPAAPLAERIAAAQHRAREEGKLVGELRAQLAAMAPNDFRARQGYVLLGRVELSLGDRPAAAAAWKRALAAGAVRRDTRRRDRRGRTEIAGHVTFASASLFAARDRPPRPTRLGGRWPSAGWPRRVRRRTCLAP